MKDACNLACGLVESEAAGYLIQTNCAASLTTVPRSASGLRPLCAGGPPGWSPLSRARHQQAQTNSPRTSPTRRTPQNEDTFGSRRLIRSSTCQSLIAALVGEALAGNMGCFLKKRQRKYQRKQDLATSRRSGPRFQQSRPIPKDLDDIPRYGSQAQRPLHLDGRQVHRLGKSAAACCSGGLSRHARSASASRFA